MDFSGFTETFFGFLTALKNNNNSKWFKKYQDDYRNCVIKPSKQFVLAMGEKLKTLSERIKCDPRVNGLGSILRIYKGVLFEKAKKPYHTEIRIYFWEGNNKKKFQNPGFFFRFGPDGGEMFSGIHKFDRVLLNAYHKAVTDDKLGPAIAEDIGKLMYKKNYSIENEILKKHPGESHQNHLHKDLLLYKGIWIKAPSISINELYKKELIDICFNHCQEMYPIHRWLAEFTASVASLYYKY